eukprot:TRINITY_DN37389_c0_g1_i1.p1 TRINITY_DN37389_c0_g1~~TRINITY_DN37389_c0_g1_i1.p1  ORF type:complete len:514 (-),score=62.19 TRINITY_DN37389_c0_g1_i1:58-1599(-)
MSCCGHNADAMDSETDPMLPVSVSPTPTAYCTSPTFKECMCHSLLSVLLFMGVAGALFYFGQETMAIAIASSWLIVPWLSLVFMLCMPQSFQLWALQRPFNPITKLFLYPVEFKESLGCGYTVGANQVVPPTLALRMSCGQNFCAAGELWLSSFRDVKKALLEPQARWYQLGEHPLAQRNLPDPRTRCMFLLALSNKGAGGTGEWDAYRSCFESSIFTKELEGRQADATSDKLFDQLARDYKAMPHGVGEEFFTALDKGILGFCIKYLNYVMFGIDPLDEVAQNAFIAMYGSGIPLTGYLSPFGDFISFDSKISAVSDVYLNKSPVFQAFKQNPAHNNMTKDELACLCVSIMRIAGVQGTFTMITALTGGYKMPLYPDAKSGPLDLVPIWDKLNLDNTSEILLYIMEGTRLGAPVSVSHRVATEDFTCDVHNSRVTFPKGTKIAIPLNLASIDPEQWGSDVYDFNMHRKGLAENWMAFNSVGDSTNGRVCPGKDLAVKTAIRVLQLLGRVRRN